MERLLVMAGGTCGSTISRHSNRTSRLTSAYGVLANNTFYAVDCGMGVQNLGKLLELGGVEEIILLQTHLHADHVHGLPEHPCLWQNKVRVRGVWSPVCEGRRFGDVWNQTFHPSNWPVTPTIRPPVHTIQGGDNASLPEGVTSFALNHPGGCIAYRIAHPKGDVVIATDHEVGSSAEADMAYANFVNGAALLIADAQYRTIECDGEVGVSGGPAMSRQGWGHSTLDKLDMALSHCKEPPGFVWITHHDPNRDQRDFADWFREVSWIDTFHPVVDEEIIDLLQIPT